MFSLEENYIREQHNIIQNLKRELNIKQKEISYLEKSVEQAAQQPQEVVQPAESLQPETSTPDAAITPFLPGAVGSLISSDSDINDGVSHKSMFLTMICVNSHNLMSITNELASVKALELIDNYYKICLNLLKKNCGILDKIFSSTMIGVFGFNNKEHLSDQEIAFQAMKFVSELDEEIAAFNVETANLGLPEIHLGIGIHSGEVLCGSIGTDNQRSFIFMGNDLLLTTKLESLNKVFNTDTIMSDTTYELVQDKIEADSQKKISIKEFNKEMMVYSFVSILETDDTPGVPVDDVFAEDSIDDILSESDMAVEELDMEDEEADAITEDLTSESEEPSEQEQVLDSAPDEELLSEFETELIRDKEEETTNEDIEFSDKLDDDLLDDLDLDTEFHENEVERINQEIEHEIDETISDVEDIEKLDTDLHENGIDETDKRIEAGIDDALSETDLDFEDDELGSLDEEGELILDEDLSSDEFDDIDLSDEELTDDIPESNLDDELMEAPEDDIELDTSDFDLDLDIDDEDQNSDK